MVTAGSVRRLLKISSARKRLLAEAVLFLFTVKILLLFLPFKKILRAFPAPGKKKEYPDQAELYNIRWSLIKADRLAFWKNRCLVQCIAGKWMLERRGGNATISFGVKHDSKGRVTAHAWLTAGDFQIIERGSDYHELYRH
jgi:hypothetical protein